MMNCLHRLSRISGAALLSGAAAVAFAQTAPALDVKVGLWELTMTSSIDFGGAPPMDTSKMTPAQRAKIEETMKMVAQQHTDVQKKCMTKEEMAKSFLDKKDDSCTDKVTSNTATLFDVTRTCTGERPSTTQAHLEASSPEKVNGTINVASSYGGNQQKMNMAFSGKWVAADCGKVK
jgi:hypothetical protein